MKSFIFTILGYHVTSCFSTLLRFLYLPSFPAVLKEVKQGGLGVLYLSLNHWVIPYYHLSLSCLVTCCFKIIVSYRAKCQFAVSLFCINLQWPSINLDCSKRNDYYILCPAFFVVFVAFLLFCVRLPFPGGACCIYWIVIGVDGKDWRC